MAAASRRGSTLAVATEISRGPQEARRSAGTPHDPVAPMRRDATGVAVRLSSGCRRVRSSYDALPGCRPAAGHELWVLDGVGSSPSIPMIVMGASYSRSTLRSQRRNGGATPPASTSRARSSIRRAPRWHRGGSRGGTGRVQFLAGVAPRRSASLPWKIRPVRFRSPACDRGRSSRGPGMWPQVKRVRVPSITLLS